jgi:spermidine/putrescine transport system ATP-binding protein
MVAGLEQPTSGQILIGGHDVTGVKPYRRPVNTVFQSYALFPHLNVFDNVAFGLRRRGARQVRAEVEAALELVELGGYGSRRPAELSGGQQQRVALARAVVNRPAVLLLDEPLGALDLQLRRQMQRELKRIQAEVGLTFIHVTHDQEEALTMADTIGVMNAGRIEQVADPVTLYERPVTTFAANFLGQSNLLSAQVVGRGEGELVVEAAGHRLRMPLDAVTTAAARAGRLWVGIRPEKLRLLAGDEDVSALNRLPGVVVDVVFTGVSIQYRVRLANAEQVTVIVQNDGAPLHRPGEHVTVTWAPQHSFGLGADQDASAGVPKESE